MRDRIFFLLSLYFSISFRSVFSFPVIFLFRYVPCVGTHSFFWRVDCYRLSPSQLSRFSFLFFAFFSFVVLLLVYVQRILLFLTSDIV